VALWHSLRRMRQSALTEYLRLRAQFGDLVRLVTRPHPVYLVSHPEAVHYVLRENAHNYRKGLLFKPLAALQGQGLLTSEGDLGARQWRLVQPVFHRQQLATCAEVMVDEARAVVQAWRQPAQTGTLVNVDDRMHRLTFNVVGRVLLGADPGALDAYRDTLRAIALLLLPFLQARTTQPWAPPLWVPTPAQLAFSTRRRRLRCPRAADHCGTTPGPAAHGRTATDVLALLLAACDDPSGARMSERQLRDEIITFIGADAETSTHALSWTWYLLAQHPAITR
jgi:cytochrome P450